MAMHLVLEDLKILPLFKLITTTKHEKIKKLNGTLFAEEMFVGKSHSNFFFNGFSICFTFVRGNVRRKKSFHFLS